MLYDVIIRIIAALGLSLIINANGITTATVVVSICIFLIYEMSIICTNKFFYWAFTIAPTIISSAYIFATEPLYKFQFVFVIIVISSLALISSDLAYQMLDYKQQLHRTRDDSVELESILKDKNRRLLLEQDQQVHLATLAERNRIAREIHDNVGHLLSRAILLLGAITTVNSDEKIAPQLKMLSDTLDESMEKMRSSVHDLHDDSIDLQKNINEILDELKNYTVNTELDLDEALPVQIKLSIIGILKEAVTNILKHSNGDTVFVILHRNYSFCTISITDNGTLTEEQQLRISTEGYEGIGLTNIKNRAASLGGEAYFNTNSGFTVFARLPFNK